MNEEVGHFSEQATATTAPKVNIYVVVLATYRLFYERFLHSLSINNDGISVFAKHDFRSHMKTPKWDAQPVFHDIHELWFNLGTTISGNFNSRGSWDPKMIENCANKSSVP